MDTEELERRLNRIEMKLFPENVVDFYDYDCYCKDCYFLCRNINCKCIKATKCTACGGKNIEISNVYNHKKIIFDN